MPKITLKGAEEVIEKLRSLRTKDMKAAVRKGSRAGSKLVQQQAKQNAPRRTGTMAQSMKVRALPRSRKWTGSVVKTTAFYLGFVELGTKKMDARRFLRNAADEVRAAVADEFVDAVREVIG